MKAGLRGRERRIAWLSEPAAIGAAVATLAACGPAMERTPRVPGRNDAMVAKADLPVWKPGDTWMYRGHTFDEKDNQFYQRVVRRLAGDRGLYEVDTPQYLAEFDARTLNPVRHRRKETGEITGAVTLNPVWFPLSFSGHFSSSGTRQRQDGGPMLPFSETCKVVGYEDVEVHAGKFAAFRIDCDWNDGFAEQWYAPDAKNLVKLRWAGNRESFSAELWDYDLTK